MGYTITKAQLKLNGPLNSKASDRGRELCFIVSVSLNNRDAIFSSDKSQRDKKKSNVNRVFLFKYDSLLP